MTDTMCSGCKEPCSAWYCNACSAKVGDRCKVCHYEIVHGRIINQNIAICGKIKGPAGVDKDPDAFRRSD